MQLPRDAVLLRVFLGKEDSSGHFPLHEAIVLKAREMHLAGATALRGHPGFGHSTRLHTDKILRLSEDKQREKPRREAAGWLRNSVAINLL